MEKVRLTLNRPISLRRIRTQAEWKVETHISLARLPTSSVTRCRISAAALLVNVMARMEPGWAFRSPTRYAIRRVSTRVLPEPAPATTSTGPPEWVTACCWGGLRPSSRRSVLGTDDFRVRGRATVTSGNRSSGRPSAGVGTKGEGALVIFGSTLDAGTDSVGLAHRLVAV